MSSALQRHAALLLADSNRTLSRGAILFVFLGYSAAVILVVLLKLDIVQGFWIPTIWAFTGGTISGVVYLLARRELVKGWLKYVVVFVLITMPTSLFVVAHFTMPSGAATYIAGPASYLYFLLIVLFGFFFDWRLPVVAGLVASIEYLGAFLIDAHHLRALTHPDPLLVQDFTQFPIYAFKAQMMFVGGIVVGVLANHARHLIDSVVKEETDKQALDRLMGEYVSPEVRDHLMKQRESGLAGEKKMVAVLFSDIRSYSTISEGLPPEAMVVQLNEYLDRMVSCVNARGGVVDKFIGDAVMAVFGGLFELENPCEQAVEAALAMHTELGTLNKAWWDKGWPAFAIGVGIHYGEVLQGSIGSANRKEFTVIGDAVNTASRIESLTKDHAMPVLISHAVFERLSQALKDQAIPLGKVQVKGKMKEVEILGMGARRKAVS